MRDTSERYSEDQVIEQCLPVLKKMGWECKRIYTGGIPVSGGQLAPNPCKGIPDHICFQRSLCKSIWIEFKRSHGGKLSDKQVFWHTVLRLCGHTVLVINSLESLKLALFSIHNKEPQPIKCTLLMEPAMELIE